MKDTCELVVTQDKVDALNWAVSARYSAMCITAALGKGGAVGKWLSRLLGAATKVLDPSKALCDAAHDPPPPDPEFQESVQLAYGPGTWQPSCDPALGWLADMAKQARRIDALEEAYTKVRAKLYGVYTYDPQGLAVILQGVFVDPVEWWDPHWIRDNVTSKLDGVKPPPGQG